MEPARVPQMANAATRQNHARRRARAAAVGWSADGRAGRAAEISGIIVVITRRRAPSLPVASLPEGAVPEPWISGRARPERRPGPGASIGHVRSQRYYGP